MPWELSWWGPTLLSPGHTTSPPLGLSIASYRRSDRFYSDQFPAWKNALDVLGHCPSLGAGCLQIGVRGWTRDFAGKVREKRESLGIALEGRLTAIGVSVGCFRGLCAARQEAGASVLRAVCLGEDGMRLSNRSHPGKRFKKTPSQRWKEPNR